MELLSEYIPELRTERVICPSRLRRAASVNESQGMQYPMRQAM